MSKNNLCSSCTHKFAECKGVPIFGKDTEKDNVIECDKHNVEFFKVEGNRIIHGDYQIRVVVDDKVIEYFDEATQEQALVECVKWIHKDMLGDV